MSKDAPVRQINYYYLSSSVGSWGQQRAAGGTQQARLSQSRDLRMDKSEHGFRGLGRS
jgi:hypothetical protein